MKLLNDGVRERLRDVLGGYNFDYTILASGGTEVGSVTSFEPI
ncbi:hypothetical protein [Bradyrhizobium tropiciagri]|nr:hypothetical protein [Bradyrhizobium tropiciagri]